MDWNDDGRKDLIVGDGRGAQTRVWWNIGDDVEPAFSTHHIEYLPADGGIRPYHETVQPCIADWNGDGRKDLIMGRNRGLYIYVNEGTNDAPAFTFDRSRLGTKLRNVFPAERLSPVFVDWDGDGRNDLVVGSQRGEVWFARNVGTQTQPAFESFTPIRANGEIIQAGSEARIAVADLDGDGALDLLVGGDSGVVWFFQARQPNPIARNQRTQVAYGAAVSVELTGSDDARRQLKYSVLSQPEHGTLTGIAPNLTYTPENNYAGRDEFTFQILVDDIASTPARVLIDVEAQQQPPAIIQQPSDELVIPGQRASLRVTASGTGPFQYAWSRNGVPIPRATGPAHIIPETDEDDSGNYSVAVSNTAGSVTSRSATLRIQPLPTQSDDVPVVDIQSQSPVVEPAHTRHSRPDADGKHFATGHGETDNTSRS